MLVPYHHARLTSVWTRSSTDAKGLTEKGGYEDRLLRSGEFASVRRRSPFLEQVYLAHPRRSISARRDGPGRPWLVEDESRRTPEQSRRRTLDLIDGMAIAGHWDIVPLVGLAEFISLLASTDPFVVAAFERFSDDGRPRVRVRIEDRSPAASSPPGGPGRSSWRPTTFTPNNPRGAKASARTTGKRTNPYSPTIDTKGCPYRGRSER